MNRYVRIHGHFYQPPRENPWLETPFHYYTDYQDSGLVNAVRKDRDDRNFGTA